MEDTDESTDKQLSFWGSGGGQLVSMCAFYSDDPSSNPAEVYFFPP